MSLEPTSFSRSRPVRPRFNLKDFLRRTSGEQGTAIMEFALVLPVGLVLFSGAYIYGTVNEINRKVTLTANELTELITQYSAISAADMTTILNASAQVMAPFSSANAIIIISEVSTNASGAGTITWSQALPTADAYANGTAVSLPTALKQANISVIWGHVSYSYTPTIGYEMTNSYNLYDDVFLMPRMSTTIAINNATSTP